MPLNLTSRTLLLASLALLLAAPREAVSAPAAAPAKPKAPAAKPADKAADKTDKKETAKTPEPVIENVVNTTPDELVSKPQEYVGRNVKFNANFFAFSSLALDYKPALRTSKTHLSFLVLRPGSHIPLSELKLAMMMPKEKDPESTLLANLKDGDQLELVGKVFSAALDDPWVEVLKVKKIGGSKDKEDDKDKTASADKPDADKKAGTDAKSDADKKPAEGESKSK
jgi:hypothetical protein